MIDHTGIIVSDFEQSKKFYVDMLATIGYTLITEIPASMPTSPVSAKMVNLIFG